MDLEVNRRLADAGIPAGGRLAVLAALEIADERGEVAATQAEIARHAGVSLSTASAGLRRARDLNLIREVKEARPSQRQPARISLRPVLRGRS